MSRYFSSVEFAENYGISPRGPAVRRDGTQHLAAAKFANMPTRLEPFEFSTEQAYTLEIGQEYIRFYVGLNRLEVDGIPVEVATPYAAEDVFSLQLIQDADVVFFTHGDYFPQELRRLDATEFEFAPRPLFPMPATTGFTFLDATLTLSATSGLDVTATLSDNVGDAFFLDGDVDRPITSGPGVAIIKSLVGSAPATSAIVTILAPFSSVGPFATEDWALALSPVVTLVLDKPGPRGALVNLQAEKLFTTSPDLIENGDFSQGGTGWTDLSAPLIVSGTHNGPTSSVALVDSTTNFFTAGVEAGHIVTNVPDESTGRADTITTSGNPNDTVNMNPPLSSGAFNAGEAYEINATGSVSYTTGSMALSAEENGIGHSQQTIINLDENSRYRIEFDVGENPVVIRVGSTPGGIDIVPKTTISVGTQLEITFNTGDFVTVYLGFSNEIGATTSLVDNVLMRKTSATAWRAQDVGKHVLGGNGVFIIQRIIDSENAEALAFAPLDTDSTLVSVTLTGRLDTFLLPVGNWTLEFPAFSEERGYPIGQTFHEGRFWYLGTRANPLGAWASKTGSFDDFSRGTNASDSISITISANQMNALEWGEPFRDLLVGTRGGEHMITGGDSPIAPGNVGQIPQGTAGSKNIRPIRHGALLIHLQRGGRHVHELQIEPNVVQLSTTRDLTVLNPSITRGGITQWTLQQQPNLVLWAVRGDGVLLGLTLEPLEDVRAWSRHTTQGLFESIARIPVDDTLTEETERLMCVVVRSVQGQPVRHIEAFIPRLEDSTQQRAELTVDDALRYDGAPASTFSGLQHLEGETVRLVQRDSVTVHREFGGTIETDRLTDLGDQVVVNGQVTTDHDVSKLDVGLAFTSRLKTVRPDIPQQDGTMQGRQVRWVRLIARVLGTVGVTIGGHSAPFRTVKDPDDLGLLPTSGDIPVDGTDWQNGGSIVVEQTNALPSTILSLMGDIEAEDIGV